MKVLGVFPSYKLYEISPAVKGTNSSTHFTIEYFIFCLLLRMLSATDLKFKKGDDGVDQPSDM